MSDLAAIAGRFRLQGEIVAVEPIRRGLINDTYRVTTTREKAALQRINAKLFPRPEITVHNLRQVLPYVRRVVLPEPIPTREGDLGYRGSGGFWRMLRWLEGKPVEEISRERVAQLASGLGKLHRDLAALPPRALEIALPHFHELDRALAQYERSGGGSALPPSLARRIDRLKPPALELYERLRRLPRRITHGDPKLDNLLLLEEGAIGWLDLDTLQPGWLWVDVSDAIRSIFSRLGAVDETLLGDFLASWLAETEEILTEAERRLLPQSLWLIPFELAVRFATDLLAGGQVFKLTPEALARRALQQIEIAEALRDGLPPF